MGDYQRAYIIDINIFEFELAFRERYLVCYIYYITYIMTTFCCFFQCGRSKRRAPALRTFFFPINEPSRCEQWIINSGNVDLFNLSEDQLKRRFICELHFKKEDFLTSKLTKGAVPIPYSQQCNITRKYSHTDITEPQPSTSRNILTNQEMVYLTPPKKHPQTLDDDENNVLADITNMPSPVKKRKYTVDEATLKRNLKNKEILSIPRNINSLPALPRALTRMQLHHKRRALWLPDEKSTALSIFYKSPSTYKYLRSKGVVLPSPSTITKWLKNYKCRPGIGKQILKFIKLKVDTMSLKTKECVLLFDEMAIKQCLEFSKNKGIIEGLEDLGELGRKPYLAKQALVFMVRGIYSNWKLPLSFIFTASGVRAEDLHTILKTNLQALNEVGLHPVSITCDQSSTNQKLFKILNISVDKPYFTLAERKYFAIFDVPHLFKTIRNNLLDADFIYDNKKVSFGDVRVVYSIDKASKTGKALPKLSDIHINPNNFQKMNVRLAVQVLSHSVSAAIRTAKETGELNTATADNTANFIELINDTFDILNSRILNSKKKYCKALSAANLDESSTSDESPLSSPSKNCVSAPEYEVTMEECSVVYFAGYLAKKSLDKFSCDNCRRTLTQDTDLTDKHDILLTVL
ncbi:THAP domain [Popillia japonica]|uniref:THAP domain n=1 Tax=Popillia japonica TaxID=7064 RepID=A0AAW1L599_POPJA